MFSTTERDEMPRTDGRSDNRAKRFSMTLILGLALPILVLWLVYNFQFRQLTDLNTIDIAQVARNISAGRGFTTSVVRPLAITCVKDVMHMPELVQSPAYAYAMALVFGPAASDRKVFATSALFFLLTIPVLYLLAKGMFNRKAAQLAVFAYITSAFMLNMVVGAGPGTMAAFVFTSLCLALFRYAQAAQTDEPGGKKPFLQSLGFRAIVAGLLFGLCYLTDAMLLFAFLPVAAFVFLAGGRKKGAGLGWFLLGFAVLALPWMVRNTSLTGNPFFGLRAMEIGMGTTAHPGLSLYRSTVPQSVLGLLQESKGEIFRKLWQGVNQSYSGLPIIGQPYLMAFFVAGLFYRFRRPGVNALRGMAIAAFFCVVIFGGMYVFQLGTVAAFAPVLLAFAAAYFIRLLTDADLHDLVGRAVTALIGVVLCIPLVTMVLQPNRARPAAHDVEQAVGLYVAPSVPILSDRAFETTWYGSRTTVWLPDTEKDVMNLDRVGHLKAIYLSSSLHPTVRTSEDYDLWRGTYNPTFERAAQGDFATMTSGPLEGFRLYRDMPPEAAGQFLQKGALLFLRPGASRQ